MEPMLKFLKSENPDIIAAQEVFDSDDQSLKQQFRTVEVFKKELGFKNAAFAPAFIDHVDGEQVTQGNAVFSNFEITQKETVFFDQPFSHRPDSEDPKYFPITPRNLQHVVVDAGVPLHIFNTQGIWGDHGGDTDRRLEMGKVIAKEIKKKSPAILCGDFNVNPNTETITTIQNHMQRVFGDEIKSTFNMKQKASKVFAEVVVDMMFITPDLSVVKKQCPNINVTDHLPLIVEFENL